MLLARLFRTGNGHGIASRFCEQIVSYSQLMSLTFARFRFDL